MGEGERVEKHTVASSGGNGQPKGFNYFRWGNSGRDLGYVSWQVDMKVRRFASRQRPKRRGGRSWTTWSAEDIYQSWGLFDDYGVAWRSESRITITFPFPFPCTATITGTITITGTTTMTTTITKPHDLLNL